MDGSGGQYLHVFTLEVVVPGVVDYCGVPHGHNVLHLLGAGVSFSEVSASEPDNVITVGLQLHLVNTAG
jgi:hypothetical protein